MKNIKFIIFLLFAFFSLVLSTSSFAQSPPSSIKKQKKNLDKRKEDRRNATVDAYTKGLKRHLKIQTKETRKKIRKDLRKANRINQNKREFFVKRWFTRKRR
ncbi:MAG: hypothetical protein PHD97_00400 [Bacteroidales bacterium]|nr:hypothetical protein [Bacteroidales bacterium]